MMKELKTLSFLIASGLLLAACGSAKDATSGKDSDILDNADPVILEIFPNILVSNGGDETILVTEKQLVFKFDDQLDKASVDALTLSFYTTASPGSPSKELKGNWSYNDLTYEVTFAFDLNSLAEGATALPDNETFTLTFNNTIKDISGNGLDFKVLFRTPQTYDVEVTTVGLPTDTSIEIRIEDKTHDNNNTNTTINSNDTLTINSLFPTGTSFLLSVNQQPNAETFCAFTSTSGTINERNASVQLNCSNVVPYNSTAANWNSYYPLYLKDVNGDLIKDADDNPILSTVPQVHGGEQRKFTMDILNNCDDLTIVDELNAFDWSCEIDNSGLEPKTTIFSTNLKAGVYLSDLLNFSRTNPGWKSNSVSVKQGSSSNLNADQASTIWWNNPVTIPTTSSSLSEFETIYIIPDNQADVTRAYIINGRHVALVVKPGVTLTTPLDVTAAILITNTGIWLEGSVNANNSGAGVLVANGFYTQIRNFAVSNAGGDGIELRNSELTYLINVTSKLNTGSGLSISGNTILPVVIHGNIAQNISLTDNSENGLFISRDSSYNKLSNVTAIDNLMDGISISLSNYISNSQASNNSGNGVVINGHNNTVTMLTTSSNGEAGILFINSSGSIAPGNNFLSSITSTSNTGDAILFDGALSADVINSNTVENMLDDSTVDTNDINPLPTVFKDHTFVGPTTTSYLENAVEPFNDNSGNDNGICEADEKCIYTPNAGHDQGVGSLVEVPGELTWTGFNIVLEEYDNISPP